MTDQPIREPLQVEGVTYDEQGRETRHSLTVEPGSALYKLLAPDLSFLVSVLPDLQVDRAPADPFEHGDGAPCSDPWCTDKDR